ncbi:MAG: GNAT family N-acetyltransferase [Pyrinomonadaceae bacterium]
MHSIETNRLRLRMFSPEDLDDLAGLFADPDVTRYVGNGMPGTREDARLALEGILKHWEDHGFGRWVAADRETGKFLGLGGLRSHFGTPELVYHLLKPNWGKGLATELAKATLRYGFEAHHFDRIVAIAKPLNSASIHVMEKLGMRYEMHANYYGLDVVQYTISRAEFQAGVMPLSDWRLVVE